MKKKLIIISAIIGGLGSAAAVAIGLKKRRDTKWIDEFHEE